MSEHMSFEVTSVCEGAVALSATERLFSWMGQHMCLDANNCCAGVLALCAAEMLLSTMNRHVPFQLKSTDAWEAALVASVCLLSIMLKVFNMWWSWSDHDRDLVMFAESHAYPNFEGCWIFDFHRNKTDSSQWIGVWERRGRTCSDEKPVNDLQAFFSQRIVHKQDRSAR